MCGIGCEACWIGGGLDVVARFEQTCEIFFGHGVIPFCGSSWRRGRASFYCVMSKRIASL